MTIKLVISEKVKDFSNLQLDLGTDGRLQKETEETDKQKKKKGRNLYKLQLKKIRRALR